MFFIIQMDLEKGEKHAEPKSGSFNHHEPERDYSLRGRYSRLNFWFCIFLRFLECWLLILCISLFFTTIFLYDCESALKCRYKRGLNNWICEMLKQMAIAAGRVVEPWLPAINE